MYNNPYYQNAYNSQISIDRINNQIADLEKMRQQLQQPQQTPSINQTFQLAPNGNAMKYVNTIDDVNKELVYSDTPFFSKDMTVMWVKNAKSDIKSYELKEIIPKDSKDLQIEYLQAQIEELKRGMRNNERNVIVDESTTKPIENEESSNVSTISRTKKKSE